MFVEICEIKQYDFMTLFIEQKLDLQLKRAQSDKTACSRMYHFLQAIPYDVCCSVIILNIFVIFQHKQSIGQKANEADRHNNTAQQLAAHYTSSACN